MRLKRRTVLTGLFGLSLPILTANCAQSDRSNTPATDASVSAQAATVRIGYQKATDLDLLRTRGELDRRLQAQGVKAEWSLFPSGPPMLEAMNAGNLDFGGVGEAPPIFAQAAGGQFYYVSLITLSPQTQDIVVPKDSPIQTVADLKGKTIALQRGSSAHYLLLRVLQDQGIAANEVEVASLAPADGRAAFEQGNVDAWSIWDPFLGVIQNAGTAKDLRLGRERRTFFLASRQFAQSQPELLRSVIEAAKANGEWAAQHPREIAEQFAADVNVDVSVLETVYRRRSWTVKPVTAETQTAQQEVANLFFDAQVIPKAIEVKSAFLSDLDYAKIFPS